MKAKYLSMAAIALMGALASCQSDDDFTVARPDNAVSVNFAVGSLQATTRSNAAATDADMHSHATYEAIVVPQTIAAGALTVSFKIGNRSFSWTNTEAITLEQGKQYTLPLTVGYDTVTLNARAFSASSWENQNGDNLGTE